MRWAVLPLLLAPLQPAAGPACEPCGAGDHPVVREVREDLEEAFRLSMTAADCSGAKNFQTCRAIEALLEEAYAGLGAIVAEAEASGSIDCLGCDPREHLTPLYGTFDAVAELLLGRGYTEIEPKLRPMQERMALWRAYRCCAQGPEPATSGRNREMDARAVLADKCGSSFERNRQGLRQVVRMPGERSGCYQSRACRDATQHNGQQFDAGFWTYDGEYWYVWAERLTSRGEWLACRP